MGSAVSEIPDDWQMSLTVDYVWEKDGEFDVEGTYLLIFDA